jgi:acetyl-CoA/propionyl-CoA carboxylase biotin carboxyl carrier protein
VGEGGEVSPMYDPMVSKLIVWDVDREAATQRMIRALGEYEIEGLTTLIPFHTALLKTDQWAAASTCRDLVEDKDWLASTAPEAVAPATRDDEAETVEHSYTVEVSGRRFDVNVIGPAFGGVAAANGAAPAAKAKRTARKATSAGGPDLLDSRGTCGRSSWRPVRRSPRVSCSASSRR